MKSNLELQSRTVSSFLNIFFLLTIHPLKLSRYFLIWVVAICLCVDKAVYARINVIIFNKNVWRADTNNILIELNNFRRCFLGEEQHDMKVSKQGVLFTSMRGCVYIYWSLIEIEGDSR